MSVTYQIEPVIDAVRAFIDQHLTLSGEPEQALPLLSAVAQYPFDPALCPLIVLEPVATTADWRRFAAGDVQLSLELHLHEIRLRTGETPSEENAAIRVLCELAAAFAADYRLGGNVQSAVVASVAIAEPAVLHRAGIPADELAVFASATLKLHVDWVESCFAAA